MNILNIKYNLSYSYSSQLTHYNIKEHSSLILFSDNSMIYKYQQNHKIKEYNTYLPPNTITVKCIEINPFNKGQ